jgi:aryl-alcohol dehydrogenase-like predicted oxidoreductase
MEMSEMSGLDETPAGAIAIGDRRVQRLGFGAMRLSNVRSDDGTPDPELGRQLVRRAVERGVTFIDTANIYGLGRSEELIAEALWPYPSDLVIATKSGYEVRALRPGERRLPASGRPEHLRAECEQSLRRLRVEQIDLYQLHTPDPAVPYADSVGALVELQGEGKVRHLGVSNVTPEQLTEAMRLGEIVSVQNRYNAGDQDSDPVLRLCERAGIAFIPWQPIVRADGHRRIAAEIAAVHKVSAQQIALAWLLRRSPVMLPIPGTTNPAHLDANIDAVWIELRDDEFDRLSAPA